MAKKTKVTVDDAIKNLINKEVDKLSASDGEDNEELELDPSEAAQMRQLSEDVRDQNIINKMMAQFPSTEGFYGKLYYKAINGKLIFKHHLDMLEEVDDPELEILNLIKERGWEDGDYVLRIFKRGQPECKQTITWSMATQSKIPSNGSSINKADNVQEKLAEMAGILNAVKDITSPSNPVNPNDTAKMMAEAFKSGADTIKSTLPPGEDTTNSLNKTIETLKSLGLLKTEEKTDFAKVMISMLPILKELGIIGQPKPPDVFAELLKFKELGLIKLANDSQEDTLGQVEKLKTLIEVVSSLTGVTGLVGGEKPSIGMKLIETLGPHVPNMVKNITDTVSNIAEVSKLKLSRGLGGIAPTPSRPSFIPPTAPPNLEEISKDKETLPEPEAATMRNPIVQEIYDSIQSNNEEYFPKLRDLINIYIGGNALDKLVGREITVFAFLQTMNQSLYETFFTEEASIKYFNNFLVWHINEIHKNMVVGICNQCGEQFDFATRQEFGADSKVCDACGTGTIEEHKTNSVGNA